MILIGEQPYVGRLMLTMRDTRKFFAERLAISRHGRYRRVPAAGLEVVHELAERTDRRLCIKPAVVQRAQEPGERVVTRGQFFCRVVSEGA
jgi:hypothetical protein